MRAIQESRKNRHPYPIDAKVRVDVGDLSFKRPKEMFVDYKSVLLKGEEIAVIVGLNAKYLYEISQALGDERVILRIPKKEDLGIQITTNPENKGLGLLMRMSHDMSS